MAVYLYKGDDKKLLKKAKKDDICADLSSKFDLWYNDLEQSRADALSILRELYPTYDNSKKEVKKVPDLYEQFKTYWSAIATGTYQNNYRGMFDVEGQDLRSNNLASIYKSAIVSDFSKINLKDTLDAMLNDWCVKGECAWFTHWDEDIEREQQVVDVEYIDPETGIITRSVEKQMVDKSDGGYVHVKRIDPHNLYYDKSQRYNWDMCGKIYRDFLPIQYILTNTAYSLTDAEKKELRKMVSDDTKNKDNDALKDKSSKEQVIWGNNIEVWEYRGDYITPDGVDYVKDAVMVVVARKYLVRIEQSEFPKCPIGYATYMDRPDTLRGQSPLKMANILADVKNKCMDLQLKGWELNVVPTFLSPKGAFQTNQKLIAGRPVEYDGSALFGGQPPQKLDFSSALRGFEFQQFFKTEMEGVTGMTQYLQGSQEGAVRTAEESSYIQSGATMRKSTEVYSFSQRVILPLVKTFALFKKVFEKGIEREIRHRNPNGSDYFSKVTDEIREGNYEFLIDGAGTGVAREAELQKLFMLLQQPAFQSLAQIMDTPTALEFLKWIMNRTDFSGTDQLFEMMNINSKIGQIANQVGIQPQNQAGFQQAMQGKIQEQIPMIAQQLLSQGQQEALPQ